jgi:hypothetical protein
LVTLSAAFLSVRHRFPTVSFVGAVGALATISATVGDYQAGSGLLIGCSPATASARTEGTPG